MNKIPPFDLSRQYQLIGPEITTVTEEILKSGRYIGGDAVKNFEQQFAEYIGVNECISCNSGTDALYLALKALNISPGDEVITSPFTFIATAETIVLSGAKPVFIDICENDFNFDLSLIAAAITPKTKAIIPVHLFGQPVNMTELMSIARKNNIYVIEDAAQATGAEWGGKKVGSIADIGCFSFYPTKNLGACGDGGAVTVNDRAIAAKIRTLADHGRVSGYIHQVTGINSRLDALQAAILQVKLGYLDSWNQKRAKVAARYQELLQPIDKIKIPQTLKEGKSVWNQYTIEILTDNRNEVRDRLRKLGINCAVYYPLPLHLQPVYRDLGYQKGQLPRSEKAGDRVLSLPMFPEIYFAEQQQIVYALKDCLT